MSKKNQEKVENENGNSEKSKNVKVEWKNMRDANVERSYVKNDFFFFIDIERVENFIR
jgi:hypothetical protein